MAKLSFEVKEISRQESLEMIQKYHYSNTLPKLNKHFIGFYLEDRLVGTVTLGWGTQPKGTIQKLFPSLFPKDYLEIGRMCMTDDMPRNSESQMLSHLVKWIKANLPDVKVLFTWADGMLGKVGYVYQASNFIYAGYSQTDVYMKDGIKIHPRQMKPFLVPKGVDDSRKGVRPTLEQMKELGLDHYTGCQYKYFTILATGQEKKELMKEWETDGRSMIKPRPKKFPLDRPKDQDLNWKKLDLETGKWLPCEKPPYRTDIDISTRDLVKAQLFNEPAELHKPGN